jgi:DNA (cytosine-5)-methyltransferase 1
MVGVDLFAGAGGMSLGAERAGVRVKVAVEADLHAARTFALNHSDTRVLAQPIQTIKQILLRKNSKHEQTVVLGGPPCQGFSTSNQRTRSVSNPTNWLFKEYVRVVRQLLPDWIVFENVTGLSVTEGGLFLETIERSFRSLGYKTFHFTLNAAEFGVPQRRNRLFVVASLHGERFVIPTPISRIVTVHEALNDLPVLSNGAIADMLPYRAVCPSAYARTMRSNLARCTNHLVTSTLTA